MREGERERDVYVLRCITLRCTNVDFFFCLLLLLLLFCSPFFRFLFPLLFLHLSLPLPLFFLIGVCVCARARVCSSERACLRWNLTSTLTYVHTHTHMHTHTHIHMHTHTQIATPQPNIVPTAALLASGKFTYKQARRFQMLSTNIPYFLECLSFVFGVCFNIKHTNSLFFVHRSVSHCFVSGFFHM